MVWPMYSLFEPLDLLGMPFVVWYGSSCHKGILKLRCPRMVLAIYNSPVRSMGSIVFGKPWRR